jgi:anti-sigma-K factor RskA
MTQHNHEAMIGLIPAYAMGAVDEDERPAVVMHLESCAECRALAAEYRSLGEDLLFAAPLAPAPAGLGENLRNRLNAQSVRSSRGRWFAFLRKPVFALGLAAFALLVLTNVYWAGRVGKLERQADALAALAQAPGIALAPANAGGNSYTSGTADGVVYVQPGSKVALLCVYAMTPLAQDKTYQAWLVKDGQRTSAGTFNVNRDGYGVLLINAEQPVSEYQQLGITVEPAGGSPAPTSPRVIGGNL